MINSQLISPHNIIVVGASMNEQKPGGKVLRNLLEGGFKGEIYTLNKKTVTIDGVIHVVDVKELDSVVDLAILAVPAKVCVGIIRELIAKGTKAFIIYSAGFSEAGEEGEQLEQELLQMINDSNSSLIGPNCIGVINENYKGVFTSPIPEYDPLGCELFFVFEEQVVSFLRVAFFIVWCFL